jgi:hypothetical protein
MSASKNSMAGKRKRQQIKTANLTLVELLQNPFRPTALHDSVQNAAIEAGWIPPWDNSLQKAKSKVAGKKSGSIRKGRADVRLLFVKAAFDRLKPEAFRQQPFADDSLDALMEQYQVEIANYIKDPKERAEEAKFLMSAAPFKADRDTLKKDLSRLGIRSKRQKKRSKARKK